LVSRCLRLEKCVVAVRKRVFDNNVELVKMFQENDPDGIGIINTIKFNYILNEYLGVPEERVMIFIRVLDPGNKSLVNYMDFCRLIHDPNSLEEMPLFKLGDNTRNQMMEQVEQNKKMADLSRDSRSQSGLNKGLLNILANPGKPLPGTLDEINPSRDIEPRRMPPPATKSVGGP
jgi:hypothetical protein